MLRGPLGSKTSVGKSLAEAIGKGNDVLRETKTTGSSTNSASNEIDNTAGNESGSNLGNQMKKTLIQVRKTFVVSSFRETIDSTFQVGEGDSIFVKETVTRTADGTFK